jgi:hypothetical protein
MEARIVTERGWRWKRVLAWNLPLLALSLATLAAFLSIRYPRTDQVSFLHFQASRLFLASVLLSIVLAFNAVGFLVFLQQRIVGLILTLLTGASVFLLVEWFLKLQSAH